MDSILDNYAVHSNVLISVSQEPAKHSAAELLKLYQKDTTAFRRRDLAYFHHSYVMPSFKSIVQDHALV